MHKNTEEFLNSIREDLKPILSNRTVIGVMVTTKDGKLDSTHLGYITSIYLISQYL
jgi:hypothetical protein